jgi:hypothetical protein
MAIFFYGLAVTTVNTAMALHPAVSEKLRPAMAGTGNSALVEVHFLFLTYRDSIV